MKKLFTLAFIALSLSAFATPVTMQVSMKGSGLDLDSIFVVGSHTDWNFVQMEDQGDSLYSVTLNIPEGDTAVYYYITIGWWAADYLDYREMVPADCDQSAELVGWDGDRAFISPADPITIAYVWGTCEEIVPSALSEFEAEEGITLYPNPAQETLNIILPEDMYSARIEILDISGKSIKQWKCAENNFVMDISDISQGLYLVKVQDGNRTFVNKVIVQ